MTLTTIYCIHLQHIPDYAWFIACGIMTTMYRYVTLVFSPMVPQDYLFPMGTGKNHERQVSSSKFGPDSPWRYSSNPVASFLQEIEAPKTPGKSEKFGDLVVSTIKGNTSSVNLEPSFKQLRLNSYGFHCLDTPGWNFCWGSIYIYISLSLSLSPYPSVSPVEQQAKCQWLDVFVNCSFASFDLLWFYEFNWVYPRL